MELDATLIKLVDILRNDYRNGVRDACGWDVCAGELRTSRDACVLNVLEHIALGHIDNASASKMAFMYGYNDATDMMAERD